MVLKVQRMKKAAAARAEAMGRRAGRDLRDLGLPTPNPFPAGELRRAWALAYAAGVALPARGRPERESAGGPSRGAAG